MNLKEKKYQIIKKTDPQIKKPISKASIMINNQY